MPQYMWAVAQYPHGYSADPCFHTGDEFSYHILYVLKFYPEELPCVFDGVGQKCFPVHIPQFQIAVMYQKIGVPVIGCFDKAAYHDGKIIKKKPVWYIP